MDQRLKKVISWTAFLVISFTIIFGVVAPTFVTMLQPTFFPETDVSGFINWIQTASVIISFTSAFLGAFSVWQASKSGKETKDVLEAIKLTTNTIKAGQEDLASFLHKPNFHFGMTEESATNPSKWVKDTVKE